MWVVAFHFLPITNFICRCTTYSHRRWFAMDTCRSQGCLWWEEKVCTNVLIKKTKEIGEKVSVVVAVLGESYVVVCVPASCKYGFDINLIFLQKKVVQKSGRGEIAAEMSLSMKVFWWSRGVPWCNHAAIEDTPQQPSRNWHDEIIHCCLMMSKINRIRLSLSPLPPHVLII